jgi:hypothetical protein
MIKRKPISRTHPPIPRLMTSSPARRLFSETMLTSSRPTMTLLPLSMPKAISSVPAAMSSQHSSLSSLT